MPKYRQVETLESLSIRSLTYYVCDVGEQLIPLLSKAFNIVLPDLHVLHNHKTSNDHHQTDDANDVDDIFEQNDADDDYGRRPSIEELRRNSCQHKKSTELLRARLKFLHAFFEYNVPCYLFDRICAQLFHELPRMVDRIKMRRTLKTSTGEFMSQVNVAVSLAEVIIGPNLTYCNFEEMPKILQQIFYTHLRQLSGLIYLNLGSLTGGWKTDDMEPTILDGLANMQNLRSLTLNYDCTDTILLNLIETCPKLHTLDLTSSKLVNNDSVNILIHMKSLRCIQLHRTSVTTEGYVKLLLAVPKLEDVGRYNEIGRCLEYIVDNYPDFKMFGLRKFSSRYVTTRFLQILSTYCPQLQYVSIFFNGLLCDLTTLIGIDKLADLHLLSCDFFSDQIRDVLAVKGCNITHLHLEHVDQIDMNALMYISQYCPDLNVFTIYNCELIESTSLYMQKPIIPPFMNLERLTVVAQCDWRHLEFMWSTCLQIKVIKCGMMVPTNDQLFERVLAQNPMEHLEELSIVRSDGLTIGMAYKMVEICPKLLILNELEGWARVQEDELEMFKTFIKTNNLIVNLDSRRFQTANEELL